MLSCELPDCNVVSEHRGYNSKGFVLSGDRAYGASGSMGWGSLTDDTCGLLVQRETPYDVRIMGVTDEYVYFNGGFEAGSIGTSLLRLPQD